MASAVGVVSNRAYLLFYEAVPTRWDGLSKRPTILKVYGCNVESRTRIVAFTKENEKFRR